MKFPNAHDIRDQGGLLLARVLFSHKWPGGILFYTEDKSPIQVASMNYNKGHHMRAHRHTIYPREAMRTNEVFIILQGRVVANVLSEQGELVEKVYLRQGDVAIFLAGGHSFDVKDNATHIIEVKNGPYFGVEQDKKFFE